MKAKVLKKFKDIKTGEIHKVNSVIDVSKKRFDEINKNGVKQKKGNLVEELKEEDPEAQETAETEAPQEENAEAQETAEEAE